MRTSYVLFAVMLSSAVPAVAQQPTVPPPSDPAPAKEKKVCRSEESTGSVFMKRVCHSSAEWSEIDARHAGESVRFREQQRNGQGTPGT
jgi:hypothetical protein